MIDKFVTQGRRTRADFQGVQIGEVCISYRRSLKGSMGKTAVVPTPAHPQGVCVRLTHMTGGGDVGLRRA